MDLNQRFWEVDSVRGIAIVMMITYHFLFDLTYFNVIDLNVSSGFLWYFARITAAVFIFLVGVSLKLSHSRAEKLNLYSSDRDFFMKYLKRGLKIFAWGIGITIMTWIFIRPDFIIFGVLHFIGVAIILSYPFLKRKYTNLVFGLSFLAVGIYLQTLYFNFTGLMWLGFVPSTIHTVDYFPLLPWFGVVLLGTFAGEVLYRDYRRNFHLPDLSRTCPVRVTGLLGRHSLLIYLAHQPVLILVLYLLGVLKISYLF
ncbi:hypothetical protein DSECCO2_263150 [anaerobic digester metagenome]